MKGKFIPDKWKIEWDNGLKWVKWGSMHPKSICKHEDIEKDIKLKHK